MPEVWFTVQWPDDSEERCYSPSTVVINYLSVGATYSLYDFQLRITTALKSASDRVELKYGHPCSRAMGQLARVNEQIKKFKDEDDPKVTCLTMSS